MQNVVPVGNPISTDMYLLLEINELSLLFKVISNGNLFEVYLDLVLLMNVMNRLSETLNESSV